MAIMLGLQTLGILCAAVAAGAATASAAPLSIDTPQDRGLSQVRKRYHHRHHVHHVHHVRHVRRMRHMRGRGRR